MKRLVIIQKIIECLNIFGCGVLIRMSFSKELGWAPSITLIMIALQAASLIFVNQLIRENKEKTKKMLNEFLGKDILKSAEMTATYVAIWDGGETIIEAPCVINLISHEVVSVDDTRRTIARSSYDKGKVDQELSQLSGEQIKFENGLTVEVVGTHVDVFVTDQPGSMMPFFKV